MTTVRIALIVAALASAAAAGPIRRVETSFRLPDLAGSPFDPVANDVRVVFEGPDGASTRVPAFFDGGSTWRARLWPRRAGRYVARRVERDGVAVDARPEPAEFVAEGSAEPGFVRVDAATRRFVHDDGRAYYPLGYNLAWRAPGEPPLPVGLARMAEIGGNWARIWMTHFHPEGMNLDWTHGPPLPIGDLSLDVARRWDAVVDAADARGVYLQVVLQHHGQYNTRTDANWRENPWNRARGGFLDAPDDFFTDPRAIALTRAKYRYVVARWGYSPRILAWELFNEVEWLAPIRDGRPGPVVAWHRAMADYLRSVDPNRHLVTTSSVARPEALWGAMDYRQPHAYPPEIVPAIRAVDAETAGSVAFLGEFGPRDIRDPAPREACLRSGLWASLMGSSAGAAQYWFWGDMGDDRYARHLRSASAFLRETGLPGRADARPIAVEVETAERVPLRFSPGASWAESARTEFAIGPDGEIPGLESMPRFLQGRAHRSMFPSATFRARIPAPARFAARIGTVAKAGASIVVRVDGAEVARLDLPAAESDRDARSVVEAPIPAGDHEVSVENPGADWLTVPEVSIDPFLPAIAPLAKGSPALVAVHLRRLGPAPAAPPPARLRIPDLAPGAYRSEWRDAATWAPVAQAATLNIEADVTPVELPRIDADAILILRRVE